MWIVKMSAYTDYWCNNFGYEPIKNMMTMKEYQMMRQFLHFVDLEGQEATRMGKISHLMEIFRKNCLSVENEKNQSIDEIMGPYKGAKAGSLKQYMPAKPNKWGFKLFARAGVSGMIYDFLV